ncbi:RNA polymerase sigma factor [Poritiphilus flavus]|uniref:Uncharacterized protein n=1 Tax=Poritiphilus flavus TaxID=2697053 RepID=A0A6L9EHK5_9FLAO|nr:hypothetical protein [Poritiphilus flavus]NAS14132.1 hypothetical protein [Poritiphilus flavus]
MELQKSSEGLSDEELVKEIVSQNNPLLFEFLYGRYAKVVYNKCYGFSRSMHEARDNISMTLKTEKGKSIIAIEDIVEKKVEIVTWCRN